MSLYWWAIDVGLSVCTSNEIEATVIRQYSTRSFQESFTLYKGASSEGVQILSKQGTDSDINKQYQYSICIERDQTYYIEYSDSGNNGWDRKSYVQIMNESHTIYKGSLGKGSSSGSDTFIYPSCQPNEVEADCLDMLKLW